jgi:alcohol dehydrogenase
LRFADPKPHERIAVLGIGGLGHLAVQYSKAAGFYTIATTHSKDKEDLASKLGADMVVSNGEALKQAGGADVILVTSNSYKAASESLKGLRPDGRMVLMGISEEPLIVTSEIIGNRSRIIGSSQNNQEYLYEALDYVAKGKVKVIAETYSLHDIGRAYENVAAGNVRFRAVIKI